MCRIFRTYVFFYKFVTAEIFLHIIIYMRNKRITNNVFDILFLDNVRISFKLPDTKVFLAETLSLYLLTLDFFSIGNKKRVFFMASKTLFRLNLIYNIQYTLTVLNAIVQLFLVTPHGVTIV